MQMDFATFWHYLRREPRRLASLQPQRSSLMLLGAISLYGVSDLRTISGRQDSQTYCSTLQSTLLPFAAEVFGEQTKCVLWQDNASTCISNFTRVWLTEHSTPIIPLPANAHDININENVWILLASLTYCRRRQPDDLASLEAVVKKRAEIDHDYYLKIYDSPKRLLVTVSDAEGGDTKC